MKRSYYYLNEFNVGDTFTTLSRTVTETDVVLFAGIIGDCNPIHTDQVYAESLPFKSRIAHGLLGAGIATGLWGRMELVEVDLKGQANSESIGGNQYSGIGGQLDHVRGARLSQGGKSILT